MPEQIYIGNFSKGQRTDRLPFALDNDAFPNLFNFYIWRGRAKKKRGTVFLGQLQIQVQSVLVPAFNWQVGPLVLVAGVGNLITGFSLPVTSTITPKSISFVVGGNTYTEPVIPDGTLLKNGVADPGSTINYATGVVTIAGGGVGPLTGTFSYFPGLPVMGLADFVSSLSSSSFPLLLAFDTKHSYQVNQNSSTVFFYNTTYYKGTNTPFEWSGDDFNLFYTTNYQKALWATNNIPGFNFVNGTYIAGSATNNITFNFKSGGANFTTLIIGDKLWFNEWPNVASPLININGLVGTVSDISGAAGGNYVVTFTTTPTVSGTGIAQLLTNTIPGKDGIKWYDGDPTNSTGLPTGSGLGWVNFAPPLTATAVSIDSTPLALYYLVGALAILPFKDRLLFFSPYIQTSASDAVPIQLQDTILWSWNGTPYYNSLTPATETFDPKAYYVDQTGLGGYLPAGISQPIKTIGNNEDAILVGFGGLGRKTRFVYTGNDLQPFLFFNINSELPSSSTFSSVVLDKGTIDIGTYGIAMTDQQSSARIDLDIPNSVFQIQTINNGLDRVNAIRDFTNEWMYFSYPLNDAAKYTDGTLCKFPTQTFFFNYREYTWAIFYENFTVHGNFRQQKKYTWQTIPFPSWNAWREPWNAGSTSALVPKIIAGNPQGYVLIIGQGTGEAKSGTIQAITNVGGNTQITSINHCVSASNPGTGDGDYVQINGALGLTGINGMIGKVIATPDADHFIVDIRFPSGTYMGLGTFTRLSQPILQTKQFNPYWEMGRKAQLKVQQYLMDFTSNSQVTVNVYLSQDPYTVWNGGSVVPAITPNPPTNNALIYSQTMFTCPESTNLGLTPANTNLQMPTATNQYQIWHRFNTSLIGDSVQIGITLNDTQMRNIIYATSEVTLHGMHLTFDKSQQLA